MMNLYGDKMPNHPEPLTLNSKPSNLNPSTFQPFNLSTFQPLNPSTLTPSTEPMYAIPARLRRMENLHIGFWLLKDISWCMIWKELGIAMIVPTLCIAIWYTWRNRSIISELAHNLAVVFWISANSYWMISEFYGFDETPVWKEFEGKHVAVIPFGIGIAVLLYYYLVLRPREKKGQTATL
jgi:hypothetical protein